MNIKRVIKKSNLEALIISFTKTVPLSLCIKDVSKKTVLALSNTDKEPLFNCPINYKGITVGELFISEKGCVTDFVIQLINNILIKEDQIAEISDETLLMYREINLLYNFSSINEGLINFTGHLEYLMEKCTENLLAENTSIWLINGEILKCSYSIGKAPKRTFKLGEGIIGEIAISSSGEMLNYCIDDSRLIGDLNEKASILLVPLRFNQNTIGVLLLSKHNATLFAARDLKLANVFAHHIALVIENNKLLEEIKKETVIRVNLSRFVSPNVVELLASQQYESALGGEEREVSVLFADIVNFTGLTEDLDSGILIEMLNEFFTIMTEIIFKYEGTVDKYIGDCVMAFFGAPNAVKDHAMSAVLTGLMMQEANVNLQYKRRKKGKLSFGVRIGIDSGLATVGNIGSPNRLEYTAIGDIVNTASRIEATAPPGGVIIGRSMYELVKDSFEIETMEAIKIKGKSKPLQVYKVLKNL